MTNTQQAKTVHGDIDYETETCSYCEREVLVDDSIQVILSGRLRPKKTMRMPEEIKADDLSVNHLCPDHAREVFGYKPGGAVIKPNRRPRQFFQEVFPRNTDMIFIILLCGMLIGFFFGLFF